MNYDVLSSDVVYDGKILQLVVDKIRYRSSGRESAREVVVKDDFVVAIPMLADGRLVLVNQFRHPFAARTATFPAGRVDPGEEPAAAAARELEEEAGYRCGKLTKIATVHEVPEFARCVGHVYLAEALEATAARREEGEATMTVEICTRSEVRRRILAGEQRSVTFTASFFHLESARPEAPWARVAAAVALVGVAALALRRRW